MTVPLHLHMADISPGKLRPVRERKPRRRQLTPHVWLSGTALVAALIFAVVGGVVIGALLVRLGEQIG